MVDGNEFAQRFVRKWLMSCAASWHGTHSVLMLILIGTQGTNKTKFFRNLLPPQLRNYYAEDGLAKVGDSELLMTQKGIICDEECAGKNKRDYMRLKELLSKQTFSIRRPYGKAHEDLQRIAVLCGTTNEEHVLDDPTGNRRIIPIQIERIDFAAYERIDKTALWMEIYHEWAKAGDSWMLDEAEIVLLNRLTERNMEVSPEAELLGVCFASPADCPGKFSEFMTNTEILATLSQRAGKSVQLSSRKLGLELKNAGFDRVQKKIMGKARYGYEVVRLDD
jgi:predicted P-loop ATPase